MNYAIINADGLVVNMVEWDGDELWSPNEGMSAIQADYGVIIGSTYKDRKFIAPAPPDFSEENLINEALRQNSAFIDEANQRIAILQDAVDLDMATDAETQSLTDWKKYRVLVNPVKPNNAPGIEWPLAPS